MTSDTDGLKELMKLATTYGVDTEPDEVLLGSSELIESLFGKQKVLENVQSASGFTGLILGMPAMLSTTDTSIITAAMNEVSTKTVLNWVKEKIGKTLQSERKAMYDEIRK